MTLKRVAAPSPNYSSRGGSAVRLVVVHTAQGAATAADLGAFFANPASGVSSHTGIDDTPGTVWEYVRRDYKAWTQANANPYCAACELTAWAEWTPAEWAAHPNMLANCAAWIAEECALFGIPVVKLSAAEAQGGQAGVCGHVDLGTAGGGHWDPGPNFPWADVLAMAAGGVVPVPPAPSPAPGTAPPWPGVYLANYLEHPAATSYQQQMVARGWTLTVDGKYGNESERVTRQFQSEKGLGVDGIVGPNTWAAAFTLPIT
jgi:N-acetyl-anhydromuramyl-L-alanine amidase AmpD